MRILIIEDHSDIAGNIGDFLSMQGHSVDFANNGELGLQLAVQHRFDSIILDINLPKMDGFTLCRALREKHQIDTPVLMLTARDSLADKVLGFQAGAWDYLVKPFALEELNVRLQALSLRQQTNQPHQLQLGELHLDTAAWSATRAGKALDLHKACLQILEILMRAAPNVVSRQDIEYMLWGDITPESDPLRSHMHELRKIMDKPFSYPMLKTVRGIGYRLISEAS
ncbi:response regulator transcription factor [Marinicella sp. W31]|uniref:response regulator transcription factor n=1 Tax=Marinicella sp. W31 TaxID=3023713 RepID=UPI003757E263